MHSWRLWTKPPVIDERKSERLLGEAIVIADGVQQSHKNEYTIDHFLFTIFVIILIILIVLIVLIVNLKFTILHQLLLQATFQISKIITFNFPTRRKK